MTASVIQITGIGFATGLMWQPLAGSNDSERQSEIKSLARELGLELSVVHANKQCVGFAKSGEVKGGVPSLAAALASQIEARNGVRDFIYVGELPDGQWYYLAQKDGVILADGDTVFDQEDHARAKYFEDSSIGDWQEVILPGHWGVSGSQECGSVAEALPMTAKGKARVDKVWMLRTVTFNVAQVLRENSKAIVLLVAVLVAATAGQYYYKDWKRKQVMAEAARMAQLAADQRAVELPRPRPWSQFPLASDLLAACMKASGTVNLFPGNWDLTAINCANGMLTVSWRPRAMGWIDHLRAVEPAVVISIDGTLASRSTPLDPLPTGLEEDLHNENERVMAMYAAAQRYGVKFSTAPAVSTTPVALPGQQAQVQAPILWSELSWKAEGVSMPKVVLAALEDNGFRMRSMQGTWSNGQIIWTMEGSQYVRK